MADEQTPADPQAVIRDLEAKNRRLEAELERLRAMIEELKRGRQRPHAPFSKGPPKSDPKPPGRKPGDAYGRHAHRLPPREVDEVYEAQLPCACPDCGGMLIPQSIEEQFQVELPRKPIHRKFNIHVGRCKRCGVRVQGRHQLQTSDALGSAASQIGPDAQSFMVHLNKVAGLSHGKVAGILGTFFGLDTNRSTSAKVMLRAAQRCTPQYKEILVHVRYSTSASSDETGWKVAALLQWLWVFVTTACTLYVIRPSRGSDVVEEVLGKGYTGRLGHDGWRAYDFLEHATHGTCITHLLRRCLTMLETSRRGVAGLPHRVKNLLHDSLALRDRRDANEISGHGLGIATGQMKARLERILNGNYVVESNARFVRHLARNKEQIFNFLRHPDLEASNWPAEQALRPAVVNRKVWGGSRTENGARAQEILMSVLRTCGQQRHQSVAFLSDILRAPPGRAPRLITR
jgi:transposase